MRNLINLISTGELTIRVWVIAAILCGFLFIRGCSCGSASPPNGHAALDAFEAGRALGIREAENRMSREIEVNVDKSWWPWGSPTITSPDGRVVRTK